MINMTGDPLFWRPIGTQTRCLRDTQQHTDSEAHAKRSRELDTKLKSVLWSSIPFVSGYVLCRLSSIHGESTHADGRGEP
jgi:hypothetical protein